MVGKKFFKTSNPKVVVEVIDFKDEKVEYSHVGYFDWRRCPLDLFLSNYTELKDQPIKNEAGIRNQLKAALENMYMFGGMPKPDPNYDRYLKNMIECVMNEVKKSV